MARRPRRPTWTTRRAPSEPRARSASSTTSTEPRGRARRAGRGAEDRRVALRRVPGAFRRGAQLLDAYGVAYELVPTLVRGLDYYTRTTWEFVGPRSGRRARFPAADATTTWWRRSAARRRPASASAPASSGSCSRSRRPGVDGRGSRASTSSSAAARAPTARPRSPQLAEAQARGLRCDTDYAGRSSKGQLTQAGSARSASRPRRRPGRCGREPIRRSLPARMRTPSGHASHARCAAVRRARVPARLLETGAS